MPRRVIGSGSLVLCFLLVCAVASAARPESDNLDAAIARAADPAELTQVWEQAWLHLPGSEAPDSQPPIVGPFGSAYVQQRLTLLPRRVTWPTVVFLVPPVPGPSAITAALSIAGLPTDRFVFEGFLPARQAARRGRLQALRHEPRTLVLFESGRRIGALLEDLGATFGPSRRATLAREMTKTYESLSHGSLAELEAHVAASPEACRGELVLVVEGAHESQVSGAGSAELESLLRILLQHVPLSEAVAIATEATGGRRNAIYRQARALAEESTHRGS